MHGNNRRLAWTSILMTLGLVFLGTDGRADEPVSAPATSSTQPAELGQRSEREVGPGEELSFRQKQVAEEMQELERRMFRLSETLKSLEPENSSRLMLGLKYAREELILHRMGELEQQLSALTLKGAVDEQQQVLGKLERLQQLLLSSDLDFEMKLERLRQIRETLRKLNAVVREEVREEKLSEQAAAKEKQLRTLADRRQALEALIEQQTDHIDKNAALAKAAELSEGAKQMAGELAKAQNATRKQTQTLIEASPGQASTALASAAKEMESAANALEKQVPRDARQPMQAALEDLKRELAAVAKEEEAARAALTPEQFAVLKEDQQANRRATDDVAEMTRRLGNSGTPSLAELMRAAGSMSAAEGAFGKSQAGQGNAEQGKALEALRYAEQLLSEEAERLARQLRREVKKRVADGLTLMLDEQVAVRKRTQELQVGVAGKALAALESLAIIAKREARITDVAQELINIVEETEFGIALPAALAAVRDSTEVVQLALDDGDATESVVETEKQIETDIKEMLEIVSEMSDANGRNARRANAGQSPEEIRKEQNRIISELRMLRLLQDRVYKSTKQSDSQRAGIPLTPALRKRIQDLEGRQQDIRDATELLAEERGDEVPLAE
jgi:hypothetical protein